jgi:prepilin-type N-terminal cleavage/methylation domain-containing protein
MMIKKILFDVGCFQSGCSKTKQSCLAHRMRGFTLIELALVVVLVSGAAVAAVKFFDHSAKGARRDDVVNVEKQ